jgi:hypothetical protein
MSGASGHGGIVGKSYYGSVTHCTSAVTLTKKENLDYCRYYGAIAGYCDNGSILSDNLAIGAVVPATDENSYGAICGIRSTGCMLERNYYSNCKVGSAEVTASGVGCGRIIVEGQGPFVSDITSMANPAANPDYSFYDPDAPAYLYNCAVPMTVQRGDANGDGSISVTDIAVVVNCILQLDNTGGFSEYGADANGDGQVTVTDIGVIVDKILGSPSPTPPEGGEPQ